MTDIFISGGRALLGQQICEASLEVVGGRISAVECSRVHGSLDIDASGLLLLPGIVDLHGDAFERQMMPRPGVDFPIDVALIDSDRQAIANGITTVFHATTWSWEPGLRSGDNAKLLLKSIEALQPQLAADTRFHLRHETSNLDAEREICRLLAQRRIDLFAFNDHMDSTVANLVRPRKRSVMVQRTGLADREFDALVGRIAARRHDVLASVARLAGAARDAGIRMLSHDDETPAQRLAFRAMGIGIAEFPVNEETAREAAKGGDFVVFGAPNVVRGGSHTGWTNASDMIAKGLCSILASDYYYPAPFLAAFRLAADGILPLPAAWDLISAAPARPQVFQTRGILAEGYRADIILVDAELPLRPRIVAVITAGHLVHLTDVSRLIRSSAARREAVAAA